MVLKYGPADNNNDISTMMITNDNLMETDPYLLFSNALRSIQTNRNIKEG
ncbi:MAG: hypothetical protein H0X03_02620 [Nitrosopumilus sp.]|nr:hypothetical protein [Nitrosopumilus sp.]